jgi:hypothetical protein
MTISRLHTNPAGLRNLGLRETASEESATVCTLVEAAESQFLWGMAEFQKLA